MIDAKNVRITLSNGPVTRAVIGIDIDSGNNLHLLRVHTFLDGGTLCQVNVPFEIIPNGYWFLVEILEYETYAERT